MTSTMDVGKQLVELCKTGQYETAINTLYSNDVVSVEAGVPPGDAPESAIAHGLAAVQGKGEWWRDNHIVHSSSVTGPWPHGDRFIVGFDIDVTFKPSGQRFPMREMGLYTVKDGKIVREEFFYSMG
jgi:ketosteroid isomerase-like protein